MEVVTQGVILQHAPGRKYRCDFEGMEMPSPALEIELFAQTKVIGLTLNHEHMTEGEVLPSGDQGPDSGSIRQAIFAIGRQDVDPEGLTAPLGMKVLAASSDHLVVDVSCYRGSLGVGSEVFFQLDYSALLRAMTSPFIKQRTRKLPVRKGAVLSCSPT